MPARRELTMRQIKQMLRLARDGVSSREIGRTLGIASSTVQDNLARASAAGLTWPLGPEVTDAVLEQRLFARTGVKQGMRRLPEPDWPSIVREMRRPGVNLTVLWEEYRETHPEGYGYSRFCDLYREFERRLTPVMRQHHAAGDKVFVDYSGKKVGIVDPATGIVREAEIFVAVLGASSLTYAEATWTQTLPDWIGAHVRLFRFLGGVPRLVVPDNLKSGVHKASFYDPELNRSYWMMAEHYGIGVLPARPRKPRDKAKVEAGVRFAQSYILGRLRRQTFFSLAECNAAIAVMVERINAHRMRRQVHHAPRPVRGGRAAGAAAAAGAGLHLRRVAAGSGQSRLPRRGGRLPVLGAPRPDPRAGRRPADGAHRRGVPSRTARRRPRTPLHRTAARHRSRPYAQRPSPLRRVEPRALPALGARHWAGDGGAGHRHPPRPAPSRAGLPHLPGYPAPLPRARPRPGGGGLGSAVALGALTYKSIASILANGLDRATPPAEAVPIMLHPNLRGPRYFH